MIATNSMPVQCTIAEAFRIPKKCVAHFDDTTIGSDSRHSFCFGSLTKICVRAMLQKWPMDLPVEHAFGAVRERSREQAVEAQLIVRNRLANLGHTVLTRFWDTTNAFNSIKRSCIVNKIKDKPYHNHILDYGAKLHIEKGAILLACGEGVARGSSAATDCFNNGLAISVQPMLNVITDKGLQFKSPFTGAIQNVGFTSFVDDLAQTTFCKEATQAPVTVSRIDKIMKFGLELNGFKQNDCKSEMLLLAQGQQAHHVTREMKSAHWGMRSHCRYLGPHLAWGHSSCKEVKLRIEAAWSCFWSYHRFWCRPVNMRLKRLIFACTITTTVLAGLSALIVTAADYKKLQQCLYSIGKRCLHGLATIKKFHSREEDLTTEYTSRGAKEINARFNIPDVETLPRIERLVRFQRVVRELAQHDLWITTFFVSYPIELETTEEVCKHNHYIQLLFDLMKVQEAGLAEALPELWFETPLHLLTNGDLKEPFLLMYMGALHKKGSWCAILPLGHVQQQGEHFMQGSYSNRISIPAAFTRWSKCQEVFESQKAFRCHQILQHATRTCFLQ